MGYHYNRTAVCVPLKRDGYVTVSQDGAMYEYHYGPNSDYGNVTWRSLTEQSSSFSQYNMMTVSSRYHDWNPIPEFNKFRNEEITLLFIQAQNVFYDNKRHDPIFSADSKADSVKAEHPRYYNSDPRASVLACVDHKEICHTTGAPCYPDITNPEPESSDKRERVGYYMLLLALRQSSIGSAVLLRGGSALDASSKLVGNHSVLLDTEQWKVEARSAFEARMQITLRDFVRGAAAEEEGFNNHIDSNALEMCTSYKFRSVGWRHCSVAGLCIVIISSILVYILGIEIETEHNAIVEVSQENAQDSHAGQSYGTLNGRATAQIPPQAPHEARAARKTRLIAAFVAAWIWGVGCETIRLVKKVSPHQPASDEAGTNQEGVDQESATIGPGNTVAYAGLSSRNRSATRDIPNSSHAAAMIDTGDGSWERTSLHRA